jgi:hypothetical protein
MTPPTRFGPIGDGGIKRWQFAEGQGRLCARASKPLLAAVNLNATTAILFRRRSFLFSSHGAHFPERMEALF